MPERRLEFEHVELKRGSHGLLEPDSLEERIRRGEHDAGRPIGGIGHQSHCWACRRHYEQQEDRNA